MGDSLKVPTVVAVVLWSASALAVMGYTYIAFKETANGLENAGLAIGGAENPLIASGNILDAELQPQKPLERGHFKKSQ